MKTIMLIAIAATLCRAQNTAPVEIELMTHAEIYEAEGSLARLYTSCGNPNCRCAEPDGRHGPYYQLSWKEAGKTVSRLLSADDARLYAEWIANRRRLESALEDMKDLSRQAGEYLLAADGRAFQGPQRPRRRRRSAGSESL